jgi:hypothetical protein
MQAIPPKRRQILDTAVKTTHVTFFRVIPHATKKKGEAIPATGRGGPWGYEMSRSPHCVDLGSPNFFSLRDTLTPPLSPKGQDLASSSYLHTVVLNYAQI